MFQNNNKEIVKRLVKRTLSSDKRRNFFVIAAIILTTFMIASVFSIGFSEYESINMQDKRMQGSLSHMGFNIPTEEQLKKIYTLDYIEAVGIGVAIGQVSDYSVMNGLNKVEIAYVDKIQWEKMFSPTYSNVVGHYPEQENEIMLSRYILDAMGIDKPKIGMEIHLSFVVDGADKVITETFILSCIYTEYTYIKRDGYGSVYTSSAFADSHGKLIADNIIVNVTFRDERRVTENIENLKQDLNFTEYQACIQNPAISNNSGWSADYTALLVISLFLMSTGYLLIYNVMYISVSRDVRFYGMLKTLGATPKQIRSIVVGQVIHLCVVGIPVGCAAAAAVSLLIVPAIIVSSGVKTGAIVSFSPLIYIGAAVFAVLTALLGATTPAKKAANITPLEALKFTGEQIFKLSIRPSCHVKPYKMALRNIFRDHKRAVFVILSLFLGIVSFSAVMTVVSGMGIDNYVNAQYDFDFVLFPNQIERPYLDDIFVKEVMELTGFKEIGITTLGHAELQYEETLEKYADWLSQKKCISKERMIENGVFAFEHGIRGIDLLELELINKTLKNPVDKNAFERGEIALINIKDNEILEYFSDVTSLDIKFNGKEDINRMPIVGIVSLPDNRGVIQGMGISTSNSEMEILVSNNFLRQNTIPQTLYVNANVQTGADEEVYSGLNNILNGSTVKMTSRYDGRKDMQETKTIMLVLGGGLSMILGIIGIFNFINVMSVGVVSRKLEFAILESVGMSRRQMKSMLRYEGMGYAMITILISTSFGSVISYGIFKLFQTTFEYADFTYPLIPILIMYLVITLICFITPEVAYRGISRMTLIERLREAE
jgi:putative ABC transport system permease protein